MVFKKIRKRKVKKKPKTEKILYTEIEVEFDEAVNGKGAEILAPIQGIFSLMKRTASIYGLWVYLEYVDRVVASIQQNELVIGVRIIRTPNQERSRGKYKSKPA